LLHVMLRLRSTQDQAYTPPEFAKHIQAFVSALSECFQPVLASPAHHNLGADSS
jgi:hypothetical protein